LNAIETNKQRPLWAENESKSEALNEKNKWDITKDINSKIDIPYKLFLWTIITRFYLENGYKTHFLKVSTMKRKVRKRI